MLLLSLRECFGEDLSPTANGLAPANELEPGITFYTRDDLLRLPQPLAVVPVTKERLFETKSEPY